MAKVLNLRPEILDVMKVSRRTCKVQLAKFKDKIDIMRRKHKLNTLGEASRGIRIYSDLTTAERRIKQIIRTRAFEEEAKGRRVTQAYKKLYVDSEEWYWDEKKDMLVQVILRKLDKLLPDE